MSCAWPSSHLRRHRPHRSPYDVVAMVSCSMTRRHRLLLQKDVPAIFVRLVRKLANRTLDEPIRSKHQGIDTDLLLYTRFSPPRCCPNNENARQREMAGGIRGEAAVRVDIDGTWLRVGFAVLVPFAHEVHYPACCCYMAIQEFLAECAIPDAQGPRQRRAACIAPS